MAVVIYNMKKPNNCENCILGERKIDYDNVSYGQYIICPLLGKPVPFKNNESFCPLDEIDDNKIKNLDKQEKSCEVKMREATTEERESIENHIKSISKSECSNFYEVASSLIIKRWKVKAVNLSANHIETVIVSANTKRKAYIIAKKELEKKYFKVIILSIEQLSI